MHCLLIPNLKGNEIILPPCNTNKDGVCCFTIDRTQIIRRKKHTHKFEMWFVSLWSTSCNFKCHLNDTFSSDYTDYTDLTGFGDHMEVDIVLL